jgi:hypothetical protein
MTTIYGFTGCCGADIFYGFSYDPQADVSPRRNIDPFTKKYTVTPSGKTWEQRFLEVLETQKNTYRKGGRMFCLILNETQYNSYDQGWPKILKREGFEFVRRWCNANHNDEQFLYLFVLCTDFKGSCKGDHTTPPKGWDSIEVKQEKVLVKPAAT